MGNSIAGNDTARWEMFLHSLDEKLQFGLLDNVRRVSGYHFEGSILYLEIANKDVEEYLRKDSNFQQLQVLAQAAVKVEKVILRAPTGYSASS